MTHTAHYQHLAQQLSILIGKIDDFRGRIEKIEQKLSHIPAPKDDTPGAINIPSSYNVQSSDPGKIPLMRVHLVQGPASETFQLPSNLSNDMVFITMVGAGGSGSEGTVDLPGSGGGAGKAIYRIPLSINGSTGRLIITAGLGGDVDSLHGTASAVEPEMKFGARQVVSAEGGKAATGRSGGSGAASELSPLGSGGNGSNGDISQSLHTGGDGGASNFAVGGKGGNKTYIKDSLDKPILVSVGQNGTYGSGGGGSVNGKPGKGGNGFVMIEYITSN